MRAVERSRQLLLYARGIEHIYPKYKVKRLTLEQLSLPNPKTFELIDGKFERTKDEKICGECGYGLYCGE